MAFVKANSLPLPLIDHLVGSGFALGALNSSVVTPLGRVRLRVGCVELVRPGESRRLGGAVLPRIWTEVWSGCSRRRR